MGGGGEEGDNFTKPPFGTKEQAVRQAKDEAIMFIKPLTHRIRVNNNQKQSFGWPGCVAFAAALYFRQKSFLCCSGLLLRRPIPL